MYVTVSSQGYGEEVVQDIFPEATIVRPADVYGHEDRFLNYYARLKSMPFGILPMLNGGVGIIKRPVYVRKREEGRGKGKKREGIMKRSIFVHKKKGEWSMVEELLLLSLSLFSQVGDVASAVMQMINDPSVKLCELVG